MNISVFLDSQFHSKFMYFQFSRISVFRPIKEFLNFSSRRHVNKHNTTEACCGGCGTVLPWHQSVASHMNLGKVRRISMEFRVSQRPPSIVSRMASKEQKEHGRQTKIHVGNLTTHE